MYISCCSIPCRRHRARVPSFFFPQRAIDRDVVCPSVVFYRGRADCSRIDLLSQDLRTYPRDFRETAGNLEDRGLEFERKKGDLRILIIMYLVYFFSRENDIYIYIALDFPVDEDKA